MSSFDHLNLLRKRHHFVPLIHGSRRQSKVLLRVDPAGSSSIFYLPLFHKSRQLFSASGQSVYRDIQDTAAVRPYRRLGKHAMPNGRRRKLNRSSNPPCQAVPRELYPGCCYEHPRPFQRPNQAGNLACSVGSGARRLDRAAASLIHQRVIADRLDALTAMVQSATQSAKSLEAKLEAHDLTRDQALAQMRKAVQARRFDHGASYMAQ